MQLGDPRGDGVDCGHAGPWSAMSESPDRGRSGYHGFLGRRWRARQRAARGGSPRAEDAECNSALPGGRERALSGKMEEDMMSHHVVI